MKSAARHGELKGFKNANGGPEENAVLFAIYTYNGDGEYRKNVIRGETLFLNRIPSLL